MMTANRCTLDFEERVAGEGAISQPTTRCFMTPKGSRAMSCKMVVENDWKVHPIFKGSLCYFIYPEICQHCVSFWLGTLWVQSGNFQLYTYQFLILQARKFCVQDTARTGPADPRLALLIPKAPSYHFAMPIGACFPSDDRVSASLFLFTSLTPPTGYYFGLLWDRVHKQRSPISMVGLLMLLLLVYYTICVRSVRCSLFLNKTLNNHC